MSNDDFQFREENELVNYLYLTIQNRPFGWYLMQLMDTRLNAQIIAWKIIHVMLSLFHKRGPFISNESHPVLLKLLDMTYPKLTTKLGIDFWIFSYHSIISSFGYLEESEFFKDAFEPLIIQLEELNEETLLEHIFVESLPRLPLDPSANLRILKFPVTLISQVQVQ